MIDIQTESLIDLAACAKLPIYRNSKTGKPAGAATLYRYILRGARATDGSMVRLETIKSPTGIRTSLEAVERFIRLLTDPDAELPERPKSEVRKQQIAAAEAELAVAGFN